MEACHVKACLFPDWRPLVRMGDFIYNPKIAFNSMGPLAQLAEQLTLNQRVVGSNPTRPTIVFKHLHTSLINSVPR